MIHVKKNLNIDFYHNKNINGKDITVAILDTGVYPHIELENKIICFKDFVNYRNNIYDDNGHGTHICGIIGGTRIGIAPKANLVCLKVLDYEGKGEIQNVIKGIEWVINNKKIYNIRIMNISIGTKDDNTISTKSLIVAVEKAWDNGIIVVASAGNNGPENYSITTPGKSRKIITVGAMDDMLGKNSLVNNYSGRGPTNECIVKPEIVTYGSNILSCKTSYNGYIKKSGTSMATAVVSGSIALLLQKNPNLTNNDVKIILKKTAIKQELSSNHQGWGALNINSILGKKLS